MTHTFGGGTHPFSFPFQVQYKSGTDTKNIYDLGVESKEDAGTIWLRCEDIMNCIAKISSSTFIGILQPTIYNKQELIKREKMVPLFGLNQYGAFEPNWEQLVLEYNTLLKVVQNNKREYIYDFSDLFVTSKLEIFKDNCHLYDQGNKIVAERIFKIIQ